MNLSVRVIGCLLISCLLLLSYAAIAATAKPSLAVSFYRNNGYSMGNDINGLFTINTEVSSNVSHVEFYLDNELQQNTTSAPFKWQFDTNNYTLGLHTIKIVAYDFLGEDATVERQPNFVGFPIGLIAGI